MKLISSLSYFLTSFSQKFIPNSFVIALILTVFTFALALIFTNFGLFSLIQFWGNGFWELLSFAMQMCLIIFTGYIVAVSPLVSRFLNSLAGLPKGPKSSILLMVILSLSLSWIHWGFSIVGSAIMVKFIASKQKVDYRLLVAAAYLGMGCTWHSGLSASAPLLVATPGHFLEKEIGLIPLSQTIFTSFNLLLTGFIFLFLCFFVPQLHPKEEETITADPLVLEKEKGSVIPKSSQKSFANLLDNSPFVGLFIGILGMIWLFWFLISKKFEINLNALNFGFLFLGILLHLRPSSFLKAAEEAGKLIFGVILQFPFYAGMYGIIKSSGLAQIVGNWFIQISSQKTYPAIVYWYSGLVNYFVPSGGSKWAIEAPYILSAAKSLGVSNSKVVIAYAWGDMATDLIQPFWAIPLLSVAKIDFKDILGYEILIFLIYIVIVSLAFLLFPL